MTACVTAASGETRLGARASTGNIPEASGVGGDLVVRLPSPVGILFVAYGPRGVTHVVPADWIAGDAAAFGRLHLTICARTAVASRDLPRALARAVASGCWESVPVDLGAAVALTPFCREVLEATRPIPPGEVRSYAWLAGQVGRPRAARAVGTALGHNPVPVVIPCHRVVRSGGDVGKYAFGSRMKRDLLDAEAAQLSMAAMRV